MSARRPIARSPRRPRTTPTTPVPPTPRWVSMPSASRWRATSSAVRCSSKASSGWAWMSRRIAVSLPCRGRTLSMRLMAAPCCCGLLRVSECSTGGGRVTLRPWKQAYRSAGRLLDGLIRGCRRSYRTPSRLRGLQQRGRARKHIVPARRIAEASECAKTHRLGSADCRSAGRREHRCKGAMPSDACAPLIATATASTEIHPSPGLGLGESEARIRPKFPPPRQADSLRRKVFSGGARIRPDNCA